MCDRVSRLTNLAVSYEGHGHGGCLGVGRQQGVCSCAGLQGLVNLGLKCLLLRSAELCISKYVLFVHIA